MPTSELIEYMARKEYEESRKATAAEKPASEEDGPEVDAGSIGPGETLYRVTYTHGHKTLKVGDLVRMVEDPRYRNLLLRTDWTMHTLADEHDQYVHLQRISLHADAMPSKP
jgi:hypothetical protein